MPQYSLLDLDHVSNLASVIQRVKLAALKGIVAIHVLHLGHSYPDAQSLEAHLGAMICNAYNEAVFLGNHNQEGFDSDDLFDVSVALGAVNGDEVIDVEIFLRLA